MNAWTSMANPAGIRTNLDRLFDERSGVILQMGFDPLPAWEPQIQLVTAWLSRELMPDCSDTLRQRMTSGHGFDRQRAVVSSIGETIERVSGGFSYSQPGVETASKKFPLIDLQRLPRFSQSELEHLDSRYGRFMPETAAFCHSVVELGTQKRYLAPSQLVFCPYHPQPEEKLFWEPTTGGLASGQSSASARVAGLLEVVERDALATSWLLRIPGQELSLREALGSDFSLVTHAIARGSVAIRLGKVSLDIPIPVCVAAICDEHSMPAIAFGAAAATEINDAAKKAIAEAALVHYTLKLRLNALDEPRYDPPVCDPSSYQEHGMAWTDHRHTSQALWFFGDRAVDTCSFPAGPPEKTLDRLLGTVGDAGYTAYSCDLTQPELTPLGWNVQRVMIPGLQPLNPGRYRRLLDSERLSKVGQWWQGVAGPATINDHVHPFC